MIPITQLIFSYYNYSNDIFVPSLSTFRAFDQSAENKVIDENSPFDRNYHPNQTAVTSGIDCSGFVERAADMTRDFYKISQGEKVSTTQIASNTNSWLISSVGQRKDWNKVVPGDILVNAGYHVMIVQSIKHSFVNGNKVISLAEDINLIHSTRGDEDWKVMTNYEWNGFRYEIKRLRLD